MYNSLHLKLLRSFISVSAGLEFFSYISCFKNKKIFKLVKFPWRVCFINYLQLYKNTDNSIKFF